MSDLPFKKKFDFSQRKEECERILRKYPERKPVIVENIKPDSNYQLNKRKFLVPCDLTMGEFIYVIRKRIRTLKPEEALYLYVNGNMSSASQIISQVYDKYKDEDGFLYINYDRESTFG